MQVMMQPQNRDMSFSLYISSLAVSDTIAMLIGKSELYSKGYIYTYKQGYKQLLPYINIVRKNSDCSQLRYLLFTKGWG